jgi:hypothetical protein
MAGAVTGDTFIGRKAQELRGLLKLNWPMEGGVVRAAYLPFDVAAWRFACSGH